MENGSFFSTSGWLRAAGLVLLAAAPGCAELAAVAPALSVDVLAVHREGTSGEGWSWGVGGRLGGTLELTATVVPGSPQHHAAVLAPPEPAPCHVPEICVWEARSRAHALARALARAAEVRR